LGQQARQAQVLLDQRAQPDLRDHQADQQDQLAQQEPQVSPAQQVRVDQQVQTVQLVQQVLLLLFLDQLDQLDHKVLQLTSEDQLQLQQRFLQAATQPMMHTSLTLTVIFTSGTELPGKVLDRSSGHKGQ
jgi:hypothetical protein